MAPKSQKTFWWIVGISAGVLLLCFGIACVGLVVSAPTLYSLLSSSSANLENTGVNVGSTAPDFELTALSGETIRLSQYAGQPVVLSFGATWCPDCNLADPILQQLHQDHPEVVVLLVDGGESLETVQASVEEHGLTFPVLLDSNDAVDKRYAIWAIPTVFFIDGDRIIRAKLIEAVTPEILAETLPSIGIEY